MRSALVLILLLAACSKSSGPIPEIPWMPGAMYRTERTPNARGLLDRRGLIHSHSVHSHDACDGKPITDAGTYDEQCLNDFRDGLCQVGHDFAFLTDHRDSFDDLEFPEVLLYSAARGDELVDHGAGPTANRMKCASGPSPLLMGGNESDMMPVGLERHADGKGATYGGNDAASVQKIHEAGALAIMAHTEAWSAQQLIDMNLDGFEMYNLHANTFKNLALAADWALKADAKMFDTLPSAPDLFLIGFNLEDPAYLTTWGTALSGGHKFTTTMGTDCHRNSLPQLAQDGERIDSYRRMMGMFSNHLLVTPLSDGSVDDRALKDALKKGRLYGAFEFLGYPVGFDYSTSTGAEMGDEVPVGTTLTVTMPKVQKLSPDGEQPELTLHLYRAIDGGWQDVASGSDATLSFVTTVAGAYRAEVRMVPKHLKPWAGRRLDLLKAERPWVYSNAIYVK